MKNKSEYEAAYKRVDDWMFLYYRKHLDDLEITDTPGYWREKEPCGGRASGCRHPIHGCLFNSGATHHTVRFVELNCRGPDGRFISRHQSWRVLKEGDKGDLEEKGE
jgi:hypothetical protein